jgi:hypothetical protein
VNRGGNIESIRGESICGDARRVGRLAPSEIAAQAYPDRSVRLVVAFSAGGTLDTLARIIAEKLGEVRQSRKILTFDPDIHRSGRSRHA